MLETFNFHHKQKDSLFSEYNIKQTKITVSGKPSLYNNMLYSFHHRHNTITSIGRQSPC